MQKRLHQAKTQRERRLSPFVLRSSQREAERDREQAVRDTHCITFFTLLLASLGLARFLPLFFIRLPLPLLLPLPFIYSSFYLLRSNTFYTCLHGSTPPALGINTDKYLCVCVCVSPIAMLLTWQIVVVCCCSAAAAASVARALFRFCFRTHTHIRCALLLFTLRASSLTLTSLLPHTHPLRRLWSNAEVNLIYCIYAGPTDAQTAKQTQRQTEPGKLTAPSSLPLFRTLHTARNP